MCGFIGVLGEKVPQEQLQRGIKSIAHRGSQQILPHFYQNNEFACGFVRLDICDLHSRANQPFYRQECNFVMCFNGEIYNHLELKEMLTHLGYSFSTSSDTEVLYYAYHHYGTQCFKLLRGMFAIAIYHLDNKSLILARDHFGIKPLYYAYRNNTLYFASEIKALASFFPLQIKNEYIMEFLSYGCTLSEHTLYQHIYELQSSTILCFKDGQIKKQNYFNLAQSFMPQEADSCSLQTYIESIQSTLLESVALHSQADVPFASQLSGGLDSSLISALASKHNHLLQAFSINLPIQPLDESYFQNLIAKKLGIQRHSLVYDDFFNLQHWQDSIFYEDFPLHHPNILASNTLNALAHNCGFKMLLSGDGSDELFCGYAWHFKQPTSIESALNLIAYVPIHTLSNVLYLPTPNIPHTLIQNYNQLGKETIMSFLGQKIYLQKWLRRQDRSGMQHSIEIRVPFVDVPLATLLNPLSISSKTQNFTQNKAILKQIAQSYLPKELIYQSKIGFPLPIKEYFQDDKAQSLYTMLFSHKSTSRGIYNTKQLQTIIQAHKSGAKDYSRLLWLICNLELWLQMLGE